MPALSSPCTLPSTALSLRWRRGPAAAAEAVNAPTKGTVLRGNIWVAEVGATKGSDPNGYSPNHDALLSIFSAAAAIYIRGATANTLRR